MKKFLIFSFLAFSLKGQTVAQSQSFYALGVSLLPQSSPKPSGWAVLTINTNVKAQIWSFSELDFTPVGSHPISIQTSALTGIATPLRQFGSVQWFAIGAGGASTIGSSSSGAISGGAALIIPLGPSKTNILLGYEAIKTTMGTTQIVKIGFGKAFGK